MDPNYFITSTFVSSTYFCPWIHYLYTTFHLTWRIVAWCSRNQPKCSNLLLLQDYYYHLHLHMAFEFFLSTWKYKGLSEFDFWYCTLFSKPFIYVLYEVFLNDCLLGCNNFELCAQNHYKCSILLYDNMSIVIEPKKFHYINELFLAITFAL